MRSSLILSTLAALAFVATEATAHVDLLTSGCKPVVKRNSRRQLVSAGEGSTPSGGGAAAARYSCDASKCQLPNCRCADKNPPGNLAINDVPQFITLTADDAIQSFTINALKQLMNGRKNPNGCPVTATYFTSLAYTNYSQVTDWYVEGNEVADHTMTHVEQPSIAEVSGNLVALNALAGIPFKSLAGFRAPFLNYSRQNLIDLDRMNFEYDSSSSSSVPVTDPNTDAFWPYTLDNGMANDCASVEGICSGEPKLPGFWEIPMYSTYETPTAPHLMDPWLDADPQKVLGWMKNTFMDHYNNQKQPFGLYSHPIHISTGYPGLPDPTPIVNALQEFLDFAHSNTSMNNVWMVSNKQLLAWMRNPVPASQLNTLDEFKCQTPDVQVDAICNGMPGKEQGKLQHCISDVPGSSLNNSPFYTCYGCPTTQPTLDVPNPPQDNSTGSVRYRIPNNCDTPFFNPETNQCLKSGFTDQTRSIGGGGAGITSTGGTNVDNGTDSTASQGDGYTCFSGACSSSGFSVQAPSAKVMAVGALAVVASLIAA